jgi:hypothetical protein
MGGGYDNIDRRWIEFLLAMTSRGRRFCRILAANSGGLWESAANILLGDATLLGHAREAVGSLEPRSSSWATLRR